MEDSAAEQGKRFYLSAPEFTVTVHYDLPLEVAIAAAGKFDDTPSEQITKWTFPSPRKGSQVINVAVVSFGCKMNSDDVIREFEKQGFRAAELSELLAWRAQHWLSYYDLMPLHQSVQIVALGSVWGGRRGVTYIEKSSFDWCEKHYLRIKWWDTKWDFSCRFAAVAM